MSPANHADRSTNETRIPRGGRLIRRIAREVSDHRVAYAVMAFLLIATPIAIPMLFSEATPSERGLLVRARSLAGSRRERTFTLETLRRLTLGTENSFVERIGDSSCEIARPAPSDSAHCVNSGPAASLGARALPGGSRLHGDHHHHHSHRGPSSRPTSAVG